MFATLVGVITGGVIGHSSQQAQRNREARINAYTDLLRSYADVQIRVAEPWRSGRFVSHGWSDWNRALAVVALVASTPVAAAANTIDEAFWRIGRGVGPAPLTNEQWRAIISRMDMTRLAFVNAARRELSRSISDLDRAGGRPPADDPLWERVDSVGVSADPASPRPGVGGFNEVDDASMR